MDTTGPDDITTRSLDDMLSPLFPPESSGFGQWSWLAERLDINRASVSKWRQRNAIPLLRVQAVCRLLGAGRDVERELLRRGGLAVDSAHGGGLPATVEAANL